MVGMDHFVTTGPKGRVFQLTEDSASPARVAGRDPITGMPREETINVIKHELFVDSKGNICSVNLRNGRAAGNSPAEEAYERLMREEQIKAGCMPLAECPWTQEYRRMTGTPTLVGELPPEGVVACNGAPDGCEHLKPIIAARRDLAARTKELDEATGAMISRPAAEAMMRSFGEGVAGQLDPRRARRAAAQAMAKGEGEGDQP
jgi:hypothetical protein